MPLVLDHHHSRRSGFSGLGYLALVVGFTTHSLGASREPLTFGAARERALAHSLDKKRAILALDMARLDASLVAAESDPRLTLSGTLSDRRPRDKDAASNARDKVFAASLSATLYDFGRAGARAAQSAARLQSEALSKDEIDERLGFAVARAFAAAIGAERIRAVVDNQARVATAKEHAQRDNYRQGLRTENDVLAAEVELGRARLALQRAIDECRATQLALSQLVGAEAIGTEFDLPAKSVAVNDPRFFVALVTKWQDFLPNAATRRQTADHDGLAALEDLVRAKMRPTLTALVTGQETAPYGATFKNQVSGQLQLSWDLPWNGVGKTELQQLSMRRSDLELASAAHLKERHHRAKEAELALRAGEAQWLAQTAQRELAVKQSEFVRRRYTFGKASTLEVQAAEGDVLAADLEAARLVNQVSVLAISIAEARNYSSRLDEVFP